jgi:cell wall assembly regulator SMI1
MKDVVRRLEAWYAKHTPAKLALRPGASDRAIAAAEKAMKIEFPPTFREWLRIHDGQAPEATIDWAPGCTRLAPLSEVVKQWKDERDMDDDEHVGKLQERGRIQNIVFHAKRIPIAGTEYWDGDKTYIDFVPGPKGKAGQIITLVTECDFVVLGETMTEFLEKYLAILESGALAFSKGTGELAPVGREYFDENPAEWMVKRIDATARKPAPAAKTPTGTKPAAKKPAAKKPAAKKPAAKKPAAKRSPKAR